VGGKEATTEVKSGETAVISANVPHIFAFLEDTLMTEVWRHPHTHTQCPFEAWYYRPFRDRVDAATLKAADAISIDSPAGAKELTT
jgi:hypothetical protein